jgi:peptidase E
VTVLVLLNLLKAFDCVDYCLFLHKLVSSFDFHESARDIVSTFLNGRSMVVNVDSVRSSPSALIYDVPQGFVPSPLFFICLSERIRHSKLHFYAG